MSLTPVRADRVAALLVVVLLAIVSACATAAGMRRGHEAEQAQDFDRAVVEYTKLARANPASTALWLITTLYSLNPSFSITSP